MLSPRTWAQQPSTHTHTHTHTHTQACGQNPHPPTLRNLSPLRVCDVGKCRQREEYSLWENKSMHLCVHTHTHKPCTHTHTSCTHHVHTNHVYTHTMYIYTHHVQTMCAHTNHVHTHTKHMYTHKPCVYAHTNHVYTHKNHVHTHTHRFILLKSSCSSAVSSGVIPTFLVSLKT